MLKISEVERGGVARELKIKEGWAVAEFDGYPAEDILDYLYYDSKNQFTLKAVNPKGKAVEFDIEKDEGESLGLVFEDDGLSIRTCRNNCIFCFVDQMPKGLRSTLYVKDDDYRMSFLCGNFVTLTNLREQDVDRILRYKLSPLYISVHTMNPRLREKMMNNRFAGKIVEYLKRFAEAGIEMHTQIVLVPGVNDGKELEYSARELFKLYPSVKTLAAVPCGITEHRDGLYNIDDINADYAKDIISLADRLNAEFKQSFLTLADEFYFKAGQKLPSHEFYGEFPQIENGVGMTAKFARDLDLAIEKREYGKTLLIACGTSVAEFISECAKKIENSCKCLKTHVIGVENKFFGSTVNCSGLLTGGDLLNAAKSFPEQFDELVICSNMLKEFEDVFLDGMTLSELSQILGKPVRVTDGTGDGFFESLTSDYTCR